ncbi:MAG: hypothetical protein OXU66_10135 [Gammaproteobacteria bacterium]|nr:hypothetical protein [Gammaproteobacteria bacterium]MDD9896935.1 hypothetical protein [Gammaproteobacteria bacterium]MDD9896937.1 hypothetical protein [Gammaproteobacteria bacterium]MDD9959288.1 hypothetical protein [Gammaproteobacteria bacterium]
MGGESKDFAIAIFPKPGKRMARLKGEVIRHDMAAGKDSASLE